MRLGCERYDAEMVLAIALASTLISPIRIASTNDRDLAVIGQAVGGKKIVEIGEATHGAAEFYQLKLRLVRYLHEQKGFNILALEAGMIETGLASLRRDELTDRQWMLSTVSGPLRWREMQPLFAYLKSRPKLRVIGIDPQFSATEVLDYAADVLAKDHPKLAEQMRQRLGEPYQYTGLISTDPEAARRAEASYLDWLKKTGQLLDEIKPSKQNAAGLHILRQGFTGLSDFWQGASQQALQQRLEARDRVMADHLFRQVGSEKVMVWAHNGHIGKGLGYKILGDYVREKRPKDVYSLGLFGKSGQWYQHWTGKVMPWEASPEGIEAFLQPGHEASFRSTSALKEPMVAYEPENGGQVSFVPQMRFDGAIVVGKLTAPTRP